MKFSSVWCYSLARKDVQSLSLIWLILVLMTEIPILLSKGMIEPVNIYFSLAEGHIASFTYKGCQNKIKRLDEHCMVSERHTVIALRIPSFLTLTSLFYTVLLIMCLHSHSNILLAHGNAIALKYAFHAMCENIKSIDVQYTWIKEFILQYVATSIINGN